MMGIVSVLLGLILGGEVTPPSPAAAVTYRCGDLVVLGRFRNLSYESVAIEDDILGHGWMISRIKVGRVLAGTPGRGTLRVRYFGHTYYREDRDFIIVIDRAGPGAASLRSAHLVDGDHRPHLATACS